jgi:hypothetical protein
MKLSAPKNVAIAGAAAMGASLIGFAALSQMSPPAQTRAVALTAGDAAIYLPDTTLFAPTVAEGIPPFDHVLQGPESWFMSNPEIVVFLEGNDTQTTIGSIVNDDFLENSIATGAPVAPLPGSEIDLLNFGGGFENEWASLSDGQSYTVTDTVITPFGNYTIPLGSTVIPGGGASAVSADAFSTVLSEVQSTITQGQQDFSDAVGAFAHGNIADGFNLDFAALNTYTFGVQDDLVEGGYDALNGQNFGEGVFFAPFDAPPPDFASGLAEAQVELASGQANIAAALSDFASNDIGAGLSLFDTGAFEVFGHAPEALILGLVDAMTISSLG